MKKQSILIVDDEPSNLTVFSSLLNPYYHVRACKTGEQALRAAGSDPQPDLILLDVMMPGMDGYTVLARLREDSRTRDIPVIFVTALSDAMDEENGIRQGAVDYITKPVKPAIMQARVRAHLEIKQSRDCLKNQNTWLEAEVERRTRENLLIQNVTLNIILELAETRDTDTGNHIDRTQAYMEVLGRQLQNHPDFAAQLEEAALARIIKAAPLHDIGKIGIPDRILIKPGKLTPEEWQIMQTHTTIGGEAIGRAVEKARRMHPAAESDAMPEALAVLETARLIAEGHHEKWDGTGYSRGLAGRAIPVPARMMALADVYDALTTPRVYKRAWTVTEAAAHIQNEKGTHFDPAVVEAFEAVRANFEAIQQRLADQADREERV